MDNAAELKSQFENNWQRFTEALPAEHVSLSMLRELRPELSYVWQCSEFIAQSCISKPELIARLITNEALLRAYNATEYFDNVHELVGEDDEAAFMQRLRYFRREQMVRIAWRDLARYAALAETMLAVSELAECAIRASHDFAWRQLITRFGKPRNSQGEVASMVVLGMGKLGGRELNYSSDIDLIFAYDNAGETDGDKSISNQEFFTKLGRKIIQYLDTTTADGFVFRTDMRLRPNGESGALVLSFSAMEQYYQIHGRSWERYALIKARVVGGNYPQGEALLRILRPFIYRKYIDYSAFSSIRDMKQLIEQGLNRRKNAQLDIKLGRGGIREVEFFIQSFQLIRGGREPDLQTESLYQAYAAMLKLKLLDNKTVDELLASYEFLRDLEHRLQMVNDRQTQLLPQDSLEQTRIAKAMGMQSYDEFLQLLMQHLDSVHAHFQTILQTEQEDDHGSLGSDRLKQMQLVWRQLQNQDVIGVLKDQGYKEAEHIQQILSAFVSGRLYGTYSSTEKDRLDQLIPLVLLEAAQMAQPKRALSRFLNVLEGISHRSVYFLLLIENPIALTQLLRLCEASVWMANYIGQYPVVLDELLQPIETEVAQRGDYAVQLQDKLAKLEDRDDEEAFMDAMREFQRAAVLHIAALDISGLLDSRAVEKRLSDIAQTIVQAAFDESIRLTAKRLPQAQAKVAVIAYGKFAGQELGYNSDLDLVICYEMSDPDAASNVKAEAEFFLARVSRKFLSILNSQTRLGRLYELDMRLRPSGNSGTLVTTFKGFRDYQVNKAWTWEHQSLVRTRVVYGDESLKTTFATIRAEVLSSERDAHKLALDVVEMRAKMVQANSQSDNDHFDLKLDYGGIVDIEFLTQYWVLRFAAAHADLVNAVAVDEILQLLAENALIDATIATQLALIYRQYLKRSLQLKLKEEQVMVSQQEFLTERQYVKNIWQQTFASLVT